MLPDFHRPAFLTPRQRLSVPASLFGSAGHLNNLHPIRGFTCSGLSAVLREYTKGGRPLRMTEAVKIALWKRSLPPPFPQHDVVQSFLYTKSSMSSNFPGIFSAKILILGVPTFSCTILYHVVPSCPKHLRGLMAARILIYRYCHPRPHFFACPGVGVGVGLRLGSAILQPLKSPHFADSSLFFTFCRQIFRQISASV